MKWEGKVKQLKTQGRTLQWSWSSSLRRSMSWPHEWPDCVSCCHSLSPTLVYFHTCFLLKDIGCLPWFFFSLSVLVQCFLISPAHTHILPFIFSSSRSMSQKWPRQSRIVSRVLALCAFERVQTSLHLLAKSHELSARSFPTSGLFLCWVDILFAPPVLPTDGYRI